MGALYSLRPVSSTKGCVHIAKLILSSEKETFVRAVMLRGPCQKVYTVYPGVALCEWCYQRAKAKESVAPVAG